MRPTSRLPAIDLARGIAMLGVALVNVHHFAVGWTMLYALDLAKQPWDVFAEYFVAILFSHRSYPVLAFLFGAGLAMQWARLPEARRTPNALRPRLWALLALGLVHGFVLWPGDVLATYAVIGLIGVGFLKGSARRTGIVAATVLTITVVIYSVLGGTQIFSDEASRAWPLAAASFADASWWAAVAQHPSEYRERGLMQLTLTDMWGWVIFGIWAARTGVLQRYLAAPLAHGALMFFGAAALVLGSGIECFAATRGGWDAFTYNEIGSGWMVLAVVPASLGGLWLWLTVAALWSVRAEATRGLKSLLIATGRAPLTQFFGQSIVFTFVFNKSLIGWHGELGRFAYSMIAMTTYILLSGFIRAWLANGHAHGPIETLWRDLTRLFSPQRVDKYPVESMPS
jgi:uncharacterized protein